MTWTYDGDPTADDVSAIHYLVGDTDTGRQLIQDEEIQFWINTVGPIYGSNHMTAAYCAESIGARFASEVAISGDGVSVSADQLQTKFDQLATALRAQYARLQGAGAVPYVGGIETFPSYDPNVKAFQFGIGMHDNLAAGDQAYGGLGDMPEVSDQLEHL
jgi:hypothetical protein